MAMAFAWPFVSVTLLCSVVGVYYFWRTSAGPALERVGKGVLWGGGVGIVLGVIAGVQGLRA